MPQRNNGRQKKGAGEQAVPDRCLDSRESRDQETGGEQAGRLQSPVKEQEATRPVGKVDLKFDEEKTTFREIETSDFGDFVTEAQVDGGDSSPF